MACMSLPELERLLVAALTRTGFSPANARALAAQTVLAQSLGQGSVGVDHVFDYIDGVRAGRIDGLAEPTLTRPAVSVISVDGRGGLPQRGFDAGFDDLVGAARSFGLSMLLSHNATLCGALGTYVLRLAEAGLVGLAATNGSVLMAGSGGRTPVYCTNPLAFAAPRSDGFPLLIDQSSSATAYVNIREAAAQGVPIPEGWALDAQGQPTTDADAALAGTLLPFGGPRGGNIALMVEVLAAGLTGANWSLDAPSFFDGTDSPATGLFVLAINPDKSAHGFADRITAQLARLAKDHGVHVPGVAKGAHREAAVQDGVDIPDGALTRLTTLADRSG